MKKIKKSSELLWVLGFVIVAFGVAICSKADLGVSMIAAPAFIISDALSTLIQGFSVGVTEYIIQGILLAAMCIIIGRFNWRYLLAFAVAVFYGYTLDFFLWLLSDVQFNAVGLRWMMLIVGDVIIAFGVACFFRTYMPLQVHELFVAEFSDRFSFQITRVKLFFDISLLVVSIILLIALFPDARSFDWSTAYYSSCHGIGLGTLVTTLINSPLIALMGKVIDKFFEPSPLFEGLEEALKRDSKN